MLPGGHIHSIIARAIALMLIWEVNGLTLGNQGSGGNHGEAEARNPPKQNLGKQPPIDM